MKENQTTMLDIFKALSDETRLSIVQTLTIDQLCACELLEIFELGITQSSLSYHMKLLTDGGLVLSSREGKWIRYSLDINKVVELQSFFGVFSN